MKKVGHYRDKSRAKRAVLARLGKREPKTSEHLARVECLGLTRAYILRLLRDLRDDGLIKLVSRRKGWVRT